MHVTLMAQLTLRCTLPQHEFKAVQGSRMRPDPIYALLLFLHYGSITGSITINSLQYADDLIIFANSQEVMQKHLDSLSEYCDKWGLSINTQKTKFMAIQNKKENVQLKINNTNIEEISTYKYLGLIFNKNGDTHSIKNDLANRALKSYFKLMKMMQPLPSIKTMIHLFDHLIKPILLYGCEVHTPVEINFKPPKSINNDRHAILNRLRQSIPIIMKFMAISDPIEKINIKFCKQMLGVNQKATNLGVYSELGRYPLFIDQIIQCIKYRSYVKFETKNSLIKEFFTEINNMPNIRHNLNTFVTQVLRNLNLQHLNESKMIKQHILTIKKKLHMQFENYWKTLLRTDTAMSGKKDGGNKLRTLNLFKTRYEFEPYLNIGNPELRKALCKLRISNHRLRIETLRFSNNYTYIPPSERTCLNCDNNCCEDECHFLIDCPAFKDNRATLWQEVHKINSHFQDYSSKNKMIWLMTQENVELLKQIAKFIKLSMDVRVS